MARSGFELILSYKFIKLMSTPFKKWDAFDLGIIDADGNSLKEAKTRDEKKSFSLFHILVRNIKRILAKLPGGKSMVGSFLAATYLLKENKLIDDKAINIILDEYSISPDLTESYIDNMVLDSDKIIIDSKWTNNQKYDILKDCYDTNEKYMDCAIFEGISILSGDKVKFIREMIK